MNYKPDFTASYSAITRKPILDSSLFDRLKTANQQKSVYL